MSNPQELVTIRVRDLVISPKNVRKTPSRTIRELAASIKHHGLLQPLTVMDVPAKAKKPKHTEVVDGGRRLQALQLLIEAGDLESDHRALCSVRTDDVAEEISVAANMHEAMHPADEFQAFKDLIDAGSTIEEVAARFGVTPLTVQRRLKLANVSPRLVNTYREGGMTLDHLMALAISDKHADQERVWNKVKDGNVWERDPQRLRAALATPGAINAREDGTARFVGLDAYEAAGGPVLRDLFSNGGGFIGDTGLLQRLAEEKLDTMAECLRAEGWSWVETRESLGYSELASLGRSQPKKRELTKDEKDEIAALRTKAEDIERKNEQSDVEDDYLIEQLGQVEAEIEAVEARTAEFSDRQMSKAGVIVTIGHDGSPVIHRGLVKPVAGKKPSRNAVDDDNRGTGTEPAMDEEVERPLSERLVTQLTAHRTAALQALVARSPVVALATLLFSLVPQIFNGAQAWRYQGVAKVNATDMRGTITRAAPDLESSPAWADMNVSTMKWADRIVDAGEDLFAWLLTQSTVGLLDLLAVCVAHTIDTLAPREDSSTHGRAHQLGAAVDLDMADWWQATGESYLASVPKSRRMAAVRDVAGEKAAEDMSTMKKDTMIAAAEEQLTGRRWLPAILRRPGAPVFATMAEAPTPTEVDQAPASNDAHHVTPKPAPVRYRDKNGNTWSGRGKRPVWVNAALMQGVPLDDLLVRNDATVAA